MAILPGNIPLDSFRLLVTRQAALSFAGIHYARAGRLAEMQTGADAPRRATA